MSKKWAAGVLALLIFYFVFLVASLSYGQQVADYFGVDMGGNVTKNVTLESTFGSQFSCGYPRYRYSTLGAASRYFFDLDNTDCDISQGAFSPNVCDYLAGCTWTNVTSGWLWFRDTTQACVGDINKSFYNDGVASEENICNMEGLQGDANTGECTAVGCTIYAPKDNAVGGVQTPLTMLDTVGDLFLFRYDFGIEDTFLNFVVTFLVFYLPFLSLLFSVYILSPLSN